MVIRGEDHRREDRGLDTLPWGPETAPSLNISPYGREGRNVSRRPWPGLLVSPLASYEAEHTKQGL